MASYDGSLQGEVALPRLLDSNMLRHIQWRHYNIAVLGSKVGDERYPRAGTASETDNSEPFKKYLNKAYDYSERITRGSQYTATPLIHLQARETGGLDKGDNRNLIEVTSEGSQNQHIHG